MYHTTGFTKAEITELCARIEARELAPGMRKWPPILGLRNALTVTLTYLRRNRVTGGNRRELRRLAAHDQPCYLGNYPTAGASASRIPRHSRRPGRQGAVLHGWHPAAVLVMAAHPELYSGKHKTTGMLVLVACNLYGHLSWISDPVEGRHHDAYCLDESGVIDTDNPPEFIGDKGFVGKGMLTPFKKPQGGKLLAWQKEFNKQINRIRYVIEQIIANFKTWRIMHTDYRRPIETFSETISAVIALHFYNWLNNPPYRWLY